MVTIFKARNFQVGAKTTIQFLTFVLHQFEVLEAQPHRCPSCTFRWRIFRLQFLLFYTVRPPVQIVTDLPTKISWPAEPLEAPQLIYSEKNAIVSRLARHLDNVDYAGNDWKIRSSIFGK